MMEQIYVIESAHQGEDYWGRTELTWEVDIDHGFFLTRDAAEAYCEAEDRKRLEKHYATYLAEHQKKEAARRRASQPSRNSSKEAEYQVLLAAGLREPRPAFVKKEALAFDAWIAQGREKSNRWSFQWRRHFDPVEVELSMDQALEEEA